MKKNMTAMDSLALSKLFMRTVVRECELQQKKGRVIDFDVELVAVFLAGGFTQIVSHWIASNFRASESEVVNVIMRLYQGDVYLFDVSYR